MLRKATQQDMARLTALRADLRGESTGQAVAWLQEIVGLENLLVVEDQPSLAAVLGAVPVEYGRRHGVWFADVLCAPDADAQMPLRLMADVLRAYAAKGYAFAVAVPPGRKARQEWAALGFRDAFPVRLVEREISHNLFAQAEFDTLTVRLLQAARQRYQPDAIELPGPTMTGILRQLYRRGITIVSNARGYGLFYTAQDTLQFIELQADNDHAADVLLQAARLQTGAEKAAILLSESQSLYLGQGRRGKYAMLCFLQKSFPITDVYFRAYL